MNRSTIVLCSGDQSLLRDFIPRLTSAVTPQDSIALNDIRRGALIIAGSGMCTGGRIRHHFKQRIWDKHTTVIFVGFQARGTLGRLLVDGIKLVNMLDASFAVKARIETSRLLKNVCEAASARQKSALPGSFPCQSVGRFLKAPLFRRLF